jgi:hypothetical protein
MWSVSKMISIRERIVKKLDDLPESDLREVLEFIEFRTWKTVGQSASLMSVAGILSGEMLSATDIETELYGHDES